MAVPPIRAALDRPASSPVKSPANSRANVFSGSSRQLPAQWPIRWPKRWPIRWIVPLAEPYLRGYAPVAERSGSLAGYRFLAPGSAAPSARKSSTARKAPPAAGFFVGYLLDAAGFPFLPSVPPECLVFWFVEPVGGVLHRRLVENPGSLGRRTTEYIRWLTHRPPRFEFFGRERIALVRHDSMRAWPREKYEHLSRNFFIETLAWLVRSALVRRLPAEMAPNGVSLAQAPRRQATRG